MKLTENKDKDLMKRGVAHYWGMRDDKIIDCRNFLIVTCMWSI